MPGNPGFLREGVKAGVCIAYLVGKLVKDTCVVRGVASIGKPGDSVVREWDKDVLAGFLHLGVKTHRPIWAYGEFAPSKFVDVGVTEAGEAGEHKSRLDVILGPVFGFGYFLHFLQGEEGAGFLFGTGFQVCVDRFARILENNALALRFVEGYHHSGE